MQDLQQWVLSDVPLQITRSPRAHHLITKEQAFANRLSRERISAIYLTPEKPSFSQGSSPRLRPCMLLELLERVLKCPQELTQTSR